MIDDFAAARGFCVDVLGWKAAQESEWVHESGDNCLGLPIDVARVRPLKDGIYQANGRTDGSI